MTTTNLKTKTDWRHHLRSARKACVAENTSRPFAIEIAAVVIPQIAAYKIIASYCAIGNEIDPRLITLSQQKYATIALPRVRAKASPLSFHAVNAMSVLQPGFSSIPEPDKNMTQVFPDVLLVPLVGVDRQGVRLGQGQGHYDATLKSLRARGKIYVIGLAYDCQLVEELPAEAHDEKLDALATPDRFLRFSGV